VTPLEKKLARRIHNQRARLRQLEAAVLAKQQHRHWTAPKWLEIACRYYRELLLAKQD
jgi:hypothetical protein